MDTKVLEIAQRIKGLREILEISVEEMADATDTSAAEYTAVSYTHLDVYKRQG